MKNFIVISLVISLSTVLNSQSKQYFDSPFGGGGGYLAGWYVPNVDPINVQLKSLGLPELSTSGFYTSGGGGFIYIGLIKNLRLGGMGYSGSMSESSVSNGVDRESMYSLGGGGLTIEYTLPFVKNFGVSVGAIVGGGNLTVDLFRNSGSTNWDDVWQNLEDGNSANSYKKINKTFWTFTPTINVDIPLYRFVLLRIGAGYQIAAGGEWKVNNDQSITSVPSDLNGNSFFIHTGIYFGFFSF